MAAVTVSGAARYFERETDDLAFDAANTQIPCYQDHFVRSREAISRSVEGLGKTALIAGAGSGHDLPLKSLGERFDRVVLVDIDIRHTRKAVESLPEELQGKFQIEQADLTGFFEEFAAGADKIAREELSFNQFGSKVMDLLLTLEKRGFSYQNIKASFVCSSLIASQLSDCIDGYLDDLSLSLYGRPLEMPDSRKTEYYDWLTQVQLGHIDELHRLVEPDGRLYYADNFSVRTVSHVKSGSEEWDIILGEEKFPWARKIQAHVAKLFSTIAENKWAWGLPYPQEKDGAEREVSIESSLREYQITSLVLSPIMACIYRS